jgi:sirohydrochlorin cobaltochelatase
MTKTGILLFAHGARDAQWARPFEQLAEKLAILRPEAPVRLAFLEFMSPDMPLAADSLVSLGCTDVQILPLFLGAGGHVRKDVPVLIAQIRSAHPTVAWTLLPTIGESDAFVHAMAQVAAAVTSPMPGKA